MVATYFVICDWLVLALKGVELAKSGRSGYTVVWRSREHGAPIEWARCVEFKGSLCGAVNQDSCE